MRMIKEVFLSRPGLLSIALIIGGILASDLAGSRISDPMGAEIVSFALLMVSLVGTSNLLHMIAVYNRKIEEEKENEKK